LVLFYSLLIILFSLLPPEQGCQNDLLYLKGHDKSPKNYGSPFFIVRVSIKCNNIKERTFLVAHCLSLSKVISDRVHCDPLSFVACGSSCHTVDFSMESNDVHQGVHSPKYGYSHPNPPWVHVFSKSSPNSSVRTQCAAAAEVQPMIPRVIHRRMHRSKKMRTKQEAMLRNMTVPTKQFKFSCAEIDNDIIVIDGGTHPCPPICPPKGIKWRSISVQDLHIEDETNGSIGLSYPKMNDISPFIRLPRAISLNIISNNGLSQIYDALDECHVLHPVSLRHSDRKQIFTDHDKPVSYACVGPQPSRNSNILRDYPPFMEGLLD
jgi:hypothetical protein